MSDLVQAHFLNATASIICLDLSDRNSYEGIENWMQDLRGQLDEGTSSNHLIFVVGLKGDLPRHHTLESQHDHTSISHLNSQGIRLPLEL